MTPRQFCGGFGAGLEVFGVDGAVDFGVDGLVLSASSFFFVLFLSGLSSAGAFDISGIGVVGMTPVE